MKHRICSTCHCRKPLSEYYGDGEYYGKGYKTCNSCRVSQNRRLRERKASGHKKGTVLGRYTGQAAAVCADCECELTPNRTILLGGESLCMPCRARRFS